MHKPPDLEEIATETGTHHQLLHLRQVAGRPLVDDDDRVIDAMHTFF